jgi:hypothetical protein
LSAEQDFEDSKSQVEMFQKLGLTKMSHFHHQKMYLKLDYKDPGIKIFNDVRFKFKKI